MRVNGEMYLLINGWFNYLCLRVTARALRIRFSRGRAAAASLFGAGYAVLAWKGPSWLRGFFAVLLIGALLSWLALGRRCIAGSLLLVLAGCLFSGLVRYLSGLGAKTWTVLFVCGGAVQLTGLILKTREIEPDGPYRLRLHAAGRDVTVPAMRDSGNLLRDPVTGLPVIVADAECVEKLLRMPVKVHDLSRTPQGLRLLTIRTAAGRQTLMCVDPDKVEILSSKKTRTVDAVVAFGDVPLGKALLPEALFENAIGEGYHAGA
ncbi:MAG: sigma-E processing peptidase SpoIIGA [Clostridia bacterium]|nr:sigma-E processing peptidase SpoIIGA [Clostridia bacterium]